MNVSGDALDMNMEAVEPIVNAVLYEGYILYPYRPGTAKNRQRWTFGGIYPEVYHRSTEGAEPCSMQTQCLLRGDAHTRLAIRLRFLQPLAREVGELPEPLDQWPRDHEPAFTPVPSLTVGERQYHTWAEALERDVNVAGCTLGALPEHGKTLDFEFPGARDTEPLTDEAGLIRGLLLRTRAHLRGHARVSVDAVTDGVWQLTVRVENRTGMDPSAPRNRDEASLYSFASTHVILSVDQGAFISLTDPPPALADAAAACDNQGVWPVLVGQPGADNMLLCSPIILSDHPQVAPESPGDLYDGTEVDEILSLNILAMTDDEKRAMAATDPRAAALLTRTESLGADDFLRMHGILREPRAMQSSPAPAIPEMDALAETGLGTGDRGPGKEKNPRESESGGPRLAFYRNGDTQLKVGDRVRLHPRAGGDVMDLVLDGKDAVIEGIERDFEDRVHVAVALDDDPGREWGLQRMPGHRFFFSPEEIESLENQPSAASNRQAQA